MNELVIHYHLSEQVHEMNAKVLNISEAKIISIAEQIVEVLGLQDDLELALIVRNEGGIRDKLKYVFNTHADTIIASFIVATLSAITAHYVTKLIDGSGNNIEQYTQEITELKAQIQANADLEIEEQRKQTDLLTKISLGIDRLNSDAQIQNEIKKKQSGLYKTLKSDENIEALSVEEIDQYTQDYVEKSRVNRDRFSGFVLEPGELEPIIDRNATIAIISPVLNNNGRYKWRGEYRGEYIDFSMADNEFKRLILSNQVKFGANDLLSGVLRINRKINEVGEEVITGYSVDEVFGFEHDGGSYTETQRGYRERLRAGAPDTPTTLYMDFEQ